MALTGLLQRCPWLEGDQRPAKCGGQGAAEHTMFLLSLGKLPHLTHCPLALSATNELLG